MNQRNMPEETNQNQEKSTPDVPKHHKGPWIMLVILAVLAISSSVFYVMFYTDVLLEPDVFFEANGIDETDGCGDNNAIPENLVKEASAVKSRNQALIWSLPAVNGVGIGGSCKHQSQAVIHIYTDRDLSKDEKQKFPSELEGVPVIVEEIGTIVPF